MNDAVSNEKLKNYCRELRDKFKLNNKILFVKGLQLNINSFELDVAKNRCYYAYPPTGLQYLAAAIEDREMKIEILDLNFEFLKKVFFEKDFDIKNWLSILEDYLQKNDPSIIAVSNSFGVYSSNFYEILNFLKNKNKIIITGGQNATYESESLLDDGMCNFVIQKEGENKINFLLDNLLGTEIKHKATPGIIFKYNNKIEETQGERDKVELKGNLIKAHELVKIEDYCKVGTLSPYSRMSGKDKPFATVIFNRGCEGGCKFCGVCDYMGFVVRSRETKDVLDELEYLYKNRGVLHFEFLDDDFARYKDKALEVLQGIIDRGIKMSWASNNGLIARTIDEDLMKKMEESGCIGFKIGVESGNPEILKSVGKPGTIETFKKFSKDAQRFPRLFIADNYIFGFPGENFKLMMESYRFSIEMNLDWSSYAIYQHNVSYFGNKDERKKKTSNLIGDFIPTKDTFKGKLDSSEKIFEGPDVFEIPRDIIPSREQLTHIWFTFNLIRNFVLNKNLMEGGNPDKFISWTSAIEERYPTHPYINFFLALAHSIKGNFDEAKIQLEKTKRNLGDNYWKEKFDRFEFTNHVYNFPKTVEEAKKLIDNLREKYHKISFSSS